MLNIYVNNPIFIVSVVRNLDMPLFTVILKGKFGAILKVTLKGISMAILQAVLGAVSVGILEAMSWAI